MDSEGNREVAAAVQAADEGAGGAAGAGGSPAGPEFQGLRRVLEGQGGPGGPCGPCGAGGPGSQSGPGTPNDRGGPVGPHCQGGLGASNGQGGPGVLGGPGVGETVGSAAAAPAAHASGPGGDAAPVGAGPGNRQIIFTLNVPFQSPLEAQMASLAMYTGAQHHLQGFQKEVTVNGNILAVWTAEDPRVLRVSFNFFLERLFLVMRNIQRIRPLLPPSLGRQKGPGS